MNVLSPIKEKFKSLEQIRENSREKSNKLEPLSNKDVIEKIDTIFYE